MCTRYPIINRVSELKVHIELTRFVQPEKIEIDANERAVNEKSQYCFFVCTTFDSFLNDFLCIQTNNYVEGELQFKDGLPLSTKKRNRAYHGFGMKSMKHLTEKYSGTLVASQEKNIFMLQIILPMPKEFVRLLKEKKKNDL